MNSTRTNTALLNNSTVTVGVWNNIAALFKSLHELAKIKITVLVTLTTALGYVLAVNSIDYNIIYAVAGIFLLACASSVLNHYQERDTDAMMERTCSRPLPSAKVLPEYVLGLSVLLFIAGSSVMFFMASIAAALAGVFTFVWYNFVYTPLKKKTALAIIPGSLVGALPPLAGWLAASGSIADFRIWLVALYFFIWQIPHFWLLLMIYGDDYANGGFPTLNSLFSYRQLSRITFSLIVTAAVTGSLIPFVASVNYIISALLMLFASVLIIYGSYRFLRFGNDKKSVVKTFVALNFYTLILTTVIIADRLF